ncbi:hypothetical protein DERP_012523 [Dermatophagoides pteronyssinus]|uniref:Uncharacterized protein n=1 Tax=Dermatophagoides pteronyssinus TaxID=6956 RepID=A0ABQ8IX84_DERPT|nr:hypothetical protein DERP_012523 [Dermatophagoides pteronyssinus]
MLMVVCISLRRRLSRDRFADSLLRRRRSQYLLKAVLVQATIIIRSATYASSLFSLGTGIGCLFLFSTQQQKVKQKP